MTNDKLDHDRKYKCKAHAKSTDKPCEHYALPGKEYCSVHVGKQGGMGKALYRAENAYKRAFGTKGLPDEHPDVLVNSMEDVVNLIVETINLVRKTKIDTKTSNAIGYLIDKLLVAIRSDEWKQRKTEAEAHLERKTFEERAVEAVERICVNEKIRHQVIEIFTRKRYPMNMYSGGRMPPGEEDPESGTA